MKSIRTAFLFLPFCLLFLLISKTSTQAQNLNRPVYDLSQLLVRYDNLTAPAVSQQQLENAVKQGILKDFREIPGYDMTLLVLPRAMKSYRQLEYYLLDHDLYGSTQMGVYKGPQGQFAAESDQIVVKIHPGQETAFLAEVQKREIWRPVLKPKALPWSPHCYAIPLTGPIPEFGRVVADRIQALPSVEFAYLDIAFTPHVTTNDTFYPYQWALYNLGTAIQYSGTPGADISMEQAWTISEGDSNIVVGVLDSGVDTLHPDLLGKLLPGYDATPGNLRGYPNTDYPQNAHGTACSGIVGAWANNGIGIAGVAPGVKIMPVRVFYYVDIPGQGVQPFATASVFAEGINYAWQNGADVLSNSWGVPDWLLDILPNPNLVSDAMVNCHSYGRDSLGAPMLFSSGNEGDPPIWPGRLPEGITVGATSMCDQWKSAVSCDGENWWASNWGGNLDISAPGVKVYTCDMTDTLGYEPGDYTPDFNGTSAACPHAAGVMALILSVRPSLTTEEARYIISHSCDRVGGYDYSTVKIAGYWSSKLGYGRINAYQALQEAQTFDSIPAVNIDPLLENQGGLEVYPNPTSGLLNLIWDQPVAGKLTWTLLDPAGREVKRLSDRFYPVGPQRVAVALGEIPAGVYLLQGSGPQGNWYRKIVLR